MAQTAMAEFYVRRGSQTSSVPSFVPAPAPKTEDYYYSDDFFGRLNRKFARSKVGWPGGQASPGCSCGRLIAALCTCSSARTSTSRAATPS